MSANYNELEKRLWEAADNLRANSKLKPSEYSVPVLGLIFLRYADFKFGRIEKELARKKRGGGGRGRFVNERGGRFDFVMANPPFFV